MSVVIPTRDTRELTLACLASFAGVEVEGLEILVVDDASRDGTAAAIAAAHPAVEVIRLAAPAGFTAAANRGLEEARGGVMLLLNSDTEVAGADLGRLLAAFAAEPRLGAAGAELYYPDGREQWSAGAAPTLAWLFGVASGLPALAGRLPLYRTLRPLAAAGRRRVDWVSGAALALRREAWREVGPLDLRFRFYAQDLDYCLRLADAGWQVAVVGECRILHRHGQTIGRVAAATSAGSHPELLWQDLLRWAAKRHGETWARRARRALVSGARLRLAGRRLAAPFLGSRRRVVWRRDTAAFSAALAALTDSA